jgi:hypothetical protein
MPEVPQEIDTSRAHPARIYDWAIGGKNHFAADRAVAEQVLAASPTSRSGPRENRAFLGRAVRYLADEAGIRQFLDIGSGLPTTSNVHEVAQAAAPSARVVYVDNDPLVLAHARALLASSPEGRTAYIQADMRDPQSILDDPATRDLIDFSQPVALMLVAVLHFIPDEDRPAEIIKALLDPLPRGSYLAASHISAELNRAGTAGTARAYKQGGLVLQPRDSDEFGRLAFAELDLIPPGVVPVSEWHRAPREVRPSAAEVGCFGAVGRKP